MKGGRASLATVERLGGNDVTWIRRGDIKECPVFRPTMEEFKDPLAYITKIEPIASKYGICKIVPPVTASIEAGQVLKKANYKFKTRVQQLRLASWDEDDQMTYMTNAKNWDVSEFQKFANKFFLRQFSVSGNVNPQKVEEQFWTELSSDSSKCVEYGSDLEGSGFSSDVDDPLGTSNWNLKKLPRLAQSILRLLPDDIPGVTDPMLYIGMLFTMFAWHVEDHYLYSMNYHHIGAPKTWYGVPGEDAPKFEQVVKDHVYDGSLVGGENGVETSYRMLIGKTTMFSPKVLVENGVQCYRAVQGPGEFVMTFPRAYHAGFSQGFNCGEAVNFAMPSWLPFAASAARRYQLLRRLPVLPTEELLCKEALCMTDTNEVSQQRRPDAAQKSMPLEIAVKDRHDWIPPPCACCCMPVHGNFCSNCGLPRPCGVQGMPMYIPPWAAGSSEQPSPGPSSCTMVMARDTAARVGDRYKSVFCGIEGMRWGEELALHVKVAFVRLVRWQKRVIQKMVQLGARTTTGNKCGLGDIYESAKCGMCNNLCYMSYVTCGCWKKPICLNHFQHNNKCQCGARRTITLCNDARQLEAAAEKFEKNPGVSDALHNLRFRDIRDEAMDMSVLEECHDSVVELEALFPSNANSMQLTVWNPNLAEADGGDRATADMEIDEWPISDVGRLPDMRVAEVVSDGRLSACLHPARLAVKESHLEKARHAVAWVNRGENGRLNEHFHDAPKGNADMVIPVENGTFAEPPHAILFERNAGSDGALARRQHLIGGVTAQTKEMNLAQSGGNGEFSFALKMSCPGSVLVALAADPAQVEHLAKHRQSMTALAKPEVIELGSGSDKVEQVELQDGAGLEDEGMSSARKLEESREERLKKRRALRGWEVDDGRPLETTESLAGNASLRTLRVRLPIKQRIPEVVNLTEDLPLGPAEPAELLAVRTSNRLRMAKKEEDNLLESWGGEKRGRSFRRRIQMKELGLAREQSGGTEEPKEEAERAISEQSAEGVRKRRRTARMEDLSRMSQVVADKTGKAQAWNEANVPRSQSISNQEVSSEVHQLALSTITLAKGLDQGPVLVQEGRGKLGAVPCKHKRLNQLSDHVAGRRKKELLGRIDSFMTRSLQSRQGGEESGSFKEEVRDCAERERGDSRQEKITSSQAGLDGKVLEVLELSEKDSRVLEMRSNGRRRTRRQEHSGFSEVEIENKAIGFPNDCEAPARISRVDGICDGDVAWECAGPALDVILTESRADTEGGDNRVHTQPDVIGKVTDGDSSDTARPSRDGDEAMPDNCRIKDTGGFSRNYLPEGQLGRWDQEEACTLDEDETAELNDSNLRSEEDARAHAGCLHEPQSLREQGKVVNLSECRSGNQGASVKADEEANYMDVTDGERSWEICVGAALPRSDLVDAEAMEEGGVHMQRVARSDDSVVECGRKGLIRDKVYAKQIGGPLEVMKRSSREILAEPVGFTCVRDSKASVVNRVGPLAEDSIINAMMGVDRFDSLLSCPWEGMTQAGVAELGAGSLPQDGQVEHVSGDWSIGNSLQVDGDGQRQSVPMAILLDDLHRERWDLSDAQEGKIELRAGSVVSCGDKDVPLSVPSEMSGPILEGMQETTGLWGGGSGAMDKQSAFYPGVLSEKDTGVAHAPSLSPKDSNATLLDTIAELQSGLCSGHESSNAVACIGPGSLQNNVDGSFAHPCGVGNVATAIHMQLVESSMNCGQERASLHMGAIPGIWSDVSRDRRGRQMQEQRQMKTLGKKRVVDDLQYQIKAGSTSRVIDVPVHRGKTSVIAVHLTDEEKREMRNGKAREKRAQEKEKAAQGLFESPPEVSGMAISGREQKKMKLDNHVQHVVCHGGSGLDRNSQKILRITDHPVVLSAQKLMQEKMINRNIQRGLRKRGHLGRMVDQKLMLEEVDKVCSSLDRSVQAGLGNMEHPGELMAQEVDRLCSSSGLDRNAEEGLQTRGSSRETAGQKVVPEDVEMFSAGPGFVRSGQRTELQNRDHPGGNVVQKLMPEKLDRFEFWDGPPLPGEQVSVYGGPLFSVFGNSPPLCNPHVFASTVAGDSTTPLKDPIQDPRLQPFRQLPLEMTPLEMTSASASLRQPPLMSGRKAPQAAGGVVGFPPPLGFAGGISAGQRLSDTQFNQMGMLAAMPVFNSSGLASRPGYWGPDFPPPPGLSPAAVFAILQQANAASFDVAKGKMEMPSSHQKMKSGVLHGGVRKAPERAAATASRHSAFGRWGGVSGSVGGAVSARHANTSGSQSSAASEMPHPAIETAAGLRRPQMVQSKCFTPNYQRLESDLEKLHASAKNAGRSWSEANAVSFVPPATGVWPVRGMEGIVNGLGLDSKQSATQGQAGRLPEPRHAAWSPTNRPTPCPPLGENEQLTFPK